MTRGLVLAADGVSATHLEYAYHRLREDAILVDVATPGGGDVRDDRDDRSDRDDCDDHALRADDDARSDHDARVGRDPALDTVPVDDLPPGRRYDLVVVPGGEAAASLSADRSTRRWLEAYLDGGGVVCAVGEGVRVLLAVGALDGRTATGPAALREGLAAAGATPTDEHVTVDGTIVTVRDTDALPFGVAAALASVAIPQDPASEARERPTWGGPGAT